MGISLLFALGLLVWQGAEVAEAFLAAYLIEKTLSIDNLFVFSLILSYFAVPDAYQPRVLVWGILGAMALRGAFIIAGFALLKAVHFTIYIFGALLVITAIHVVRHGHQEVRPDRNPVLRGFRYFVPITDTFHGQRLLVRQDGKLQGTPLLAVLVLIETSDVIFAIDSVPAVFAVTDDSFIAFTAVILALLGLRALYFLIDDLLDRFRYLRQALAAVLAFVGIKLLLTDVYRLPIRLSLLIIAGIIAVSMVTSWYGTAASKPKFRH